MPSDLQVAVTGAQLRVLEALRRLDDDGWPVHVRDLAADLGYAGPSYVHDILHQLKGKGLAEQDPRSVRGGWRAVAR